MIVDILQGEIDQSKYKSDKWECRQECKHCEMLCTLDRSVCPKCGSWLIPSTTVLKSMRLWRPRLLYTLFALWHGHLPRTLLEVRDAKA